MKPTVTFIEVTDPAHGPRYRFKRGIFVDSIAQVIPAHGTPERDSEAGSSSFGTKAYIQIKGTSAKELVSTVETYTEIMKMIFGPNYELEDLE